MNSRTRLERYQKSEDLFARALEVIPLGAQTFSKSHIIYPERGTPRFLSHGKGSRAWDVDGNEYVDLSGALGPIILGYGDPDVDAAAIGQIGRGVSFSLATALEVEVAELLREIIPCAEMVRFGKNGSDATSGAIRVARAYTGRDRVAVCGYHGWQDWYIGATTRNKGIPRAVCELTERFAYNDPASLDALLKSHPGEFAAVILEPMSLDEPKEGFLQVVRDLAHAHGALFIIDEIVTGFRFGVGGVHTEFDVVPDLAAFGKAMANGFPISAVVGKREFMREMEEIFFSSTFGGEAVSLAASLATIRKLRNEPVLASIERFGNKVIAAANRLITRHGVGHCISVVGRPQSFVIRFSDAPGATSFEIKTLYLQEILAHGVLSAGGIVPSYAHNDADVAVIETALDAAFGAIARGLRENQIPRMLSGRAIQPIFKVR